MQIFYINFIKLKPLKAFNSTLQFACDSTTAKNRAAPAGADGDNSIQLRLTKLMRNDQQNRRQVSQSPMVAINRSISMFENGKSL